MADRVDRRDVLDTLADIFGSYAPGRPTVDPDVQVEQLTVAVQALQGDLSASRMECQQLRAGYDQAVQRYEEAAEAVRQRDRVIHDLSSTVQDLTAQLHRAINDRDAALAAKDRAFEERDAIVYSTVTRLRGLEGSAASGAPRETLGADTGAPPSPAPAWAPPPEPSYAAGVDAEDLDLDTLSGPDAGARMRAEIIRHRRDIAALHKRLEQANLELDAAGAFAQQARLTVLHAGHLAWDNVRLSAMLSAASQTVEVVAEDALAGGRATTRGSSAVPARARSLGPAGGNATSNNAAAASATTSSPTRGASRGRSSGAGGRRSGGPTTTADLAADPFADVLHASWRGSAGGNNANSSATSKGATKRKDAAEEATATSNGGKVLRVAPSAAWLAALGAYAFPAATPAEMEAVGSDAIAYDGAQEALRTLDQHALTLQQLRLVLEKQAAGLPPRRYGARLTSGAAAAAEAEADAVALAHRMSPTVIVLRSALALINAVGALSAGSSSFLGLPPPSLGAASVHEAHQPSGPSEVAATGSTQGRWDPVTGQWLGGPDVTGAVSEQDVAIAAALRRAGLAGGPGGRSGASTAGSSRAGSIAHSVVAEGQQHQQQHSQQPGLALPALPPVPSSLEPRVAAAASTLPDAASLIAAYTVLGHRLASDPVAAAWERESSAFKLTLASDAAELKAAQAAKKAALKASAEGTGPAPGSAAAAAGASGVARVARRRSSTGPSDVPGGPDKIGLPPPATSEAKAWVPTEAVVLCAKFRQTHLPALPVATVRSFLLQLNGVWMKRYQLLAQRIHARYEAALEHIRRSAKFSEPYREVIQASTIARLTSELQAARAALGAAPAVTGTPGPATPYTYLHIPSSADLSARAPFANRVGGVDTFDGAASRTAAEAEALAAAAAAAAAGVEVPASLLRRAAASSRSRSPRGTSASGSRSARQAAGARPAASPAAASARASAALLRAAALSPSRAATAAAATGGVASFGASVSGGAPRSVAPVTPLRSGGGPGSPGASGRRGADIAASARRGGIISGGSNCTNDELYALYVEGGGEEALAQKALKRGAAKPVVAVSPTNRHAAPGGGSGSARLPGLTAPGGFSTALLPAADTDDTLNPGTRAQLLSVPGSGAQRLDALASARLFERSLAAVQELASKLEAANDVRAALEEDLERANERIVELETEIEELKAGPAIIKTEISKTTGRNTPAVPRAFAELHGSDEEGDYGAHVVHHHSRSQQHAVPAPAPARAATAAAPTPVAAVRPPPVPPLPLPHHQQQQQQQASHAYYAQQAAQAQQAAWEGGHHAHLYQHHQQQAAQQQYDGSGASANSGGSPRAYAAPSPRADAAYAGRHFPGPGVSPATDARMTSAEVVALCEAVASRAAAAQANVLALSQALASSVAGSGPHQPESAAKQRELSGAGVAASMQWQEGGAPSGGADPASLLAALEHVSNDLASQVEMVAAVAGTVGRYSANAAEISGGY